MADQDAEDLMYESLKDKFKGFDSAGNAVIDDGGKLASFKSSDFPKFNQKLKEQYGEKSYEDEFNQKQYEDIAAKGAKFQGFAGDNAIFRNEQGDLENFGSQGGFAKFLKKQNPSAVFDISKQGNANRSNYGYQASTDFLGQKKATDVKTGSNIGATINRLGGKLASPTTASTATPQPTQDTTKPEPVKFEPPKPAAQKKQPTFTATKKSTIQAQQKQQGVSQPPSLLQTGLNLAQNYAKDEANKQAQTIKSNAQQEAIQQAANTLGVDKSLITNPKDYAVNQANQAISDYTGLDTQAITNPADYLKQQAISKLAEQTGIDPALAGMLQGNVKDNALNVVKSLTSDTTGIPLEYLNVLQGNVVNNVKDLAVDKAKEEALTQGLSAAGLDPTGGYAAAALGAGKALLGGGSSEDKGRAAAQAAARAALAGATGGIVSPETLALSSSLADKTADFSKKALGNTVGGIASAPLEFSSATGKIGADALNTALGGIGDIGATYGRNFSSANEGVKQILGGNIEEGLSSLGSAAFSTLKDNLLKNPTTALKSGWDIAKNAVGGVADLAKKGLSSVGNAVSNVISSIFCFAPDTEILMANGKYKKIKLIKIGDEVMLGGRVEAIGQGYSDDMWSYDGVEVSGGHAVYEDGVWTRVNKSKYGVKIQHTEEVIVYPMATANHYIITKGQAWADLYEVDNTFDKKDTDIINELNNQKQANAMLDMFLKTYFKKK